MYESRKLYDLDINILQPDPMQPRKHIDNESIDELSNSIKELGILQQIIFRLDENGTHMIVAGQRRWEAAKRANFKNIPAIFIGDKTPEIALTENILRQNLTAVEEAEAMQRLIDEFHYDREGLVRLIGKANSSISEILGLNRLSDEIKNDCRSNNKLSRGKLIEISKEKIKEKMNKLYEKVKKQGLSKDEIRSLNKKNDSSKKKYNKFELLISSIKELDRKIKKFKLELSIEDLNKKNITSCLNEFIFDANEFIKKIN